MAGHELATILDQDSSSTSRQSSQGKNHLQKMAQVSSVTPWFCQFSRPNGQSAEAGHCLIIKCVFTCGALLYDCTLISGNDVTSLHCCVGGVSDNDSEAYASLVQHQRTLLSTECSGPCGSEADLAEDTLCPADCNQSDPDAVALHETCIDEPELRLGSGLHGSLTAQPKQLQSCKAKLRVKHKHTKHRSKHKHPHAYA